MHQLVRRAGYDRMLAAREQRRHRDVIEALPVCSECSDGGKDRWQLWRGCLHIASSSGQYNRRNAFVRRWLFHCIYPRMCSAQVAHDCTTKGADAVLGGGGRDTGSQYRTRQLQNALFYMKPTISGQISWLMCYATHRGARWATASFASKCSFSCEE